MRKISFIILAIILCITLSGCELIAEKPQENGFSCSRQVLTTREPVPAF